MLPAFEITFNSKDPSAADVPSAAVPSPIPFTNSMAFRRAGLGVPS